MNLSDFASSTPRATRRLWLGLTLFVLLAIAVISSQVYSHIFETMWGNPDRIGPSTPPTEMNFPSGLASDSLGNIYVLDLANYRICKFDGSGVPVNFSGPSTSCIGSFGNGPGELTHAFGIALDGADNLYVADGGLSRVCQWNNLGIFQTCWGTKGTAVGEFDFQAANALAADSSGKVYVVDSNNNRVCKFTGSGAPDITFGGSGCVGLNELVQIEFFLPDGIAVDQSEKVYVLDSGNFRICRLESDGDLDLTFGMGGCAGTGPGSGPPNAPVGEFYYGHRLASKGVAVGVLGEVYVVDRGNHRVCKFDSSGNPEDFVGPDPDSPCIGIHGTGGTGTNGQFQLPAGLTLASGHLFVADWGNNRIQKFDTDGTPFIITGTQNWWGSDATEPGDMNRPNGIAIHPGSGDNYVTDTYNHRVCWFSSAGILGDCFGGLSPTDKFYFPTGISIDAAGDFLYVLDAGNNRLCQFDVTNTPPGVPTPVTAFGTDGCVNTISTAQNFTQDGYLGLWYRFAAGVATFTDEFNNTVVYVSRTNDGDVCAYSGLDGSVIACPWVGSLDIDGFYTQNGVAVDQSGNVYIAGIGLTPTFEAYGTVRVFDSSGTYLKRCGNAGSGPGQFIPYGVRGLAVNSAGNVYVGDGSNNRIQELEDVSQWVDEADCPVVHYWGIQGNADGEFFHPVGVAVDSADNLYAVDRGNSRVQKFSLSIPATFLTVTKAGTGSGTVTSSPSGINCGTDCTETYSFGTVVTLTAIPDTDSAFTEWSGDGDCSDDGMGNIATVTINSAVSCTATFTSNTHTLTLNTTGTGTGSVSGAGVYNFGDTATVSATADALSTFDGWSGSDAIECTTGSVLMDADKSCTATFTLLDTDGDGYPDLLDNCPLTPNDQTDTDGDNVGDACDLCPTDPNPCSSNFTLPTRSIGGGGEMMTSDNYQVVSGGIGGGVGGLAESTIYQLKTGVAAQVAEE